MKENLKIKFKRMVLDYIPINGNDIDDAIQVLKELPKFKEFSKETLEEIKTSLK